MILLALKIAVVVVLVAIFIPLIVWIGHGILAAFGALFGVFGWIFDPDPEKGFEGLLRRIFRVRQISARIARLEKRLHGDSGPDRLSH